MANYSIEKYANTTEADSYTVSLSPDALSLGVSGGTVSHTNSGATISVYKGSTQLQAVSGSTPGVGQFAVDQSAITDTNITVGSQSVSGSNLLFGDTSSMTQTTASIDFPINIENVITITRTQNFVQATAGSDGDDGHSGWLTNPVHVVSADNDGTNYSLSGAGGTFERYDGGTSKTGSATTYYVGASGTSTSATQNGLTFSITQSTGVYTLSGGSWTSDEEQFTVRAIYDSVTITAVYSIAKAKDGPQGQTGTAKRRANGYLYYNTQQASAPSAPSNSSVSYNFSNGTMSGGVIGTGATDWSLTAPAATGGQAGSKMYYIYWFVEETSVGGGTGSPTFGSTVYTATNFVGLVRFSGTNTLTDGSGTSTTALTSTDLGSSGTTVIDGGRIETGTIDADRISTGLLRIGGTNFEGSLQDGSIGGWTIDSNSIFTGTKDASGYTTSGITISGASGGSIHAKEFYIDTSGNANFKGDITGASGTFSGTVQVGGTSLTTTNTLNANTVGSDLGGGYGDNSIGGLTLAATKIYIGTGTHNNSNTAFYVDNAGKFSLKDKLSWDGSTLNVNGNITLGAGSSGNISVLTNDSGFTDDTAANAAQNDADDANDKSTHFDTNGDISGGISVGSSGHIKGGQSAYNNGTGFFLGYSGGAYKFSIGNASNKALTWDGSTMTIRGNLQLVDGTVPTDDTVANTKTTASEAASAANSQDKTGGSVGGWSLSSSTISSTNITLDNTHARILIED